MGHEDLGGLTGLGTLQVAGRSLILVGRRRDPMEGGRLGARGLLACEEVAQGSSCGMGLGQSQSSPQEQNSGQSPHLSGAVDLVSLREPRRGTAGPRVVSP